MTGKSSEKLMKRSCNWGEVFSASQFCPRGKTSLGFWTDGRQKAIKNNSAAEEKSNMEEREIGMIFTWSLTPRNFFKLTLSESTRKLSITVTQLFINHYYTYYDKTADILQENDNIVITTVRIKINQNRGGRTNMILDLMWLMPTRSWLRGKFTWRREI